jgi:hypothetical protein
MQSYAVMELQGRWLYLFGEFAVLLKELSSEYNYKSFAPVLVLNHPQIFF